MKEDNWDFALARVRARIETGTILMEMKDCYCIVVDRVLPDGIVCRELHDPASHYTWAELKRRSFHISGHTRDHPNTVVGVVVRGRSGRFEERALPEIVDLSALVAAKGFRAELSIDRAFVRLVLDRLPVGWADAIVIARVAPDGAGEETPECSIVCDSKDLRCSTAVQAAVQAQYDFAAARQASSWSGLTLRLASDTSGMRYDLEFSY